MQSRRGGLGFAVVSACAALVLGACGGADEGGRSATCEQSTSTPGSIELKARWSVGDRREVTVDKRRRINNSGEGLVATARLEVVGRSGDGWRLRLDSDDMTLLLPGSFPLEPDVLRALERVRGGVVVTYSTDAAGSIVRLEDVEDVRRRIGRLLDTMFATDTSLDPATKAAIRELLLTDEQVEAAALQDLELLHDVYGAQLVEGRTCKRTTEIASPSGGAPIPATAEVTLDDARGPSGFALIQTNAVAERDALKGRLDERGGDAGDPRIELELRRAVRSSYDAESGWVVRADATRTFQASLLLEERTIVTSR